MKPILYESTETLFQSNGLGVLSDCISAHVVEERNGQYEAEFEYPVDGIHYSDILEGRIILISHDESGDLQPFDIYGHSKTINGVTTFYAHHIAYRQNGITVKPFTATSLSQTLTKIKSNSVNTNPFNYSTDKSVSASFQLTSPKPLRSILGGEEGSLLDVYGTGEYEWDRFQVILHLHRGTDSGVVVRYGKNLVSLQDDIDYSDSYNGIVPFWFGQNEPADGEEAVETLVTLSEWVLYKSGSTYDGRNTVIPVDFSAQFQTIPTEAQLRSAAQSYLDRGNPLLPTDTLTFDFVELSKTEEYSYLALQQVNLCDTVTVVYDDINTAMKVISVDWDVLNERYRSLTLGDAPATYAQVITDRLATIAENANEGAKLAKLWATNALSIAGNTDQYFWFTGTGTDTGAHITETPKETFLADPTHGGGNLIARSNGIAVRDGLTELATFGANGSQVGLSSSGHAVFNANGMEVFDGSNSLASFGTTVRVGANVDGQSRVEISSSGIGFKYRVDSSNTWGLANIEFRNAYGNHTIAKSPTFTFGVRGSGSYGQYSFVVGSSNMASELLTTAFGLGTSATETGAFAEGWSTTASGKYSHAEGYMTTAGSDYQHVMGKCNANNSNNAFEIGNGTVSAPTNIFQVGWNGNVFTAGTLSVGGNFYVDSSGNVNLALGSHYKINGTNLSASDVGAVPTTRTVNSKALSSNITLTASDVGALPISGGTLTGGLTLSAGNVINVYTGKSSSAGGWANPRFRFLDADGTEYAWIGAYGNGDTFSYIYLGANAYNGNNLRVYDDGHIWANGIVNNGTYNALYKITDATVSVPAGSAGNISSASYSMTAQSGYKAVGIVGISLGSFNVRPLTYYIESDTSIRAGFTRLATTSQAYNVVFKILWLKATSA